MSNEHTPSGWWWLSFVDPDRPRGQRFMGACIVEGGCMASAALSARRAGCNPGGEAMGMSILEGRLPPESWRNRLLNRGECVKIEEWGNARWPEDAKHAR